MTALADVLMFLLLEEHWWKVGVCAALVEVWLSRHLVDVVLDYWR